jgi:hypothetical protein
MFQLIDEQQINNAFLPSDVFDVTVPEYICATQHTMTQELK